MSLTAAQLQTLRADLAANTATVVVGGTTFPINSTDVLPADHSPPSDEAAQKVAAWYNAAASPAYVAWHPAVDRTKIDQLVDLSAYTPADAVPASPSTDLTYSNRAFICQLKQANAIKLTQGTGTLDARQAGLRKNFQDCLRAVPSGASGAASDAGWGPPATPGAVRLGLQHNATVAEKLLGAAGSGVGNTGGDARGSTTNPDVAGTDTLGNAVTVLTALDVKTAWGS